MVPRLTQEKELPSPCPNRHSFSSGREPNNNSHCNSNSGDNYSLMLCKLLENWCYKKTNFIMLQIHFN